MTAVITTRTRSSAPTAISRAVAQVLVVEDDYDLRLALELQLAAADVRVASVADGTAALTHIRQLEPDVVILDLGLPGIDGLDLLERLRDLRKPPKVIVLSAWDETRCQPLAVARGAALYLEKPVPFEEILAAVRFLLDQQG